MTDATFNLLQLESRPNWYDHLAAAEQAMRQQEADWAIRKEYEWDGDDGFLKTLTTRMRMCTR
jgi:hypothetical protein